MRVPNLSRLLFSERDSLEKIAEKESFSSNQMEGNLKVVSLLIEITKFNKKCYRDKISFHEESTFQYS